MAITKATRTVWQCTACAARAPKWVGQCPSCRAWDVMVEVAPSLPGSPARPAGAGGVRRIGEVEVESVRARSTGVSELDRVLGGGLVPGAVVLLAGEPGVGKSTLLLEVAAATARTGRDVLYVSGEESAGQVRLRAERTGGLDEHLWLAAETSLSAVLAHLDEVQPALLVLDSVQTIAAEGVEGSAGGVTQVREVAAALTRVAKDRGIATVLVGHVTKDGSIAGPRVLEHLVDVVLHFEGEKHSALRVVRAVKNRYGPCDEVGCFEMVEAGIVAVTDPSGLFLSHTAVPVAGTCVTVAMEGRRALLTEVQALVGSSATPNPRRAVSGLDTNRVAMVLAVVERRGRVRINGSDVYTATVGGVRVVEPAADLAVALAIASAVWDVPVPPKTIVLGEVGLAGEVRRVSGLEKRLSEAARMGYTTALVPVPSANQPPVSVPGLKVVQVADLGRALAFLRENGQPGV